MIDRESALKSVQKSEDKLFIARVLDKAARSERSDSVQHTDFLDPRQKALAEGVFRNSNLEYTFSGGYAGAEREVMFFRSGFVTQEELEDEIFNALRAVSIRLGSPAALSHRDYLGSIMALGIKREKTGDIIVNETGAYIITLYDIAEYISSNIFKIGSTGITAEVVETDEISIPERDTRQIRSTVASLRLDSITATAFGVSRTKAADLIRADKVSLNWEVINNITRQLKEGDVISIRGKGRAVLSNIGGTTRKDRIFIEIDRYI